MLRGSATPAGTVAYRTALGGGARNGHFREWRGLALSSVGIGTYLGPDDDVTDALYETAIERGLRVPGERGARSAHRGLRYVHVERLPPAVVGPRLPLLAGPGRGGRGDRRARASLPCGAVALQPRHDRGLHAAQSTGWSRARGAPRG